MKYLIIIDLQNDFCKGVFKNEAVEKMIPNLCKYILNHRHKYDKIILTQDTHNKEEYEKSEESKQFPIHCVKDTEGWKIIKSLWNILHENKILRKKIIRIEKDKFYISESKWKEVILNKHGEIEIDIVGTATEYCVYENYKILSTLFGNVNIIPEFCVGLNYNNVIKVLNEIPKEHKKYMYSSQMIYNKLIEYIQNLFNTEFKGLKAVIGVSGGKDSSVVLTLLVRALGKDKVIPVAIPNGEQKDISDSYEICKFNGYSTEEVLNINIYSVMNALNLELNEKLNKYFENVEINKNKNENTEINKKAFEDVEKCSRYKTNTPARIRMTVLYSISALKGGVVANTCNLSEDYVGYSTKFGDSAGDFSLLNHLTVDEVVRLGEFMNIPDKLIHKIPDDGMCGKSDEDNLGFSYSILDMYIRHECLIDDNIKNKIMKMHESGITKSKLGLIPKNLSFKYLY